MFDVSNLPSKDIIQEEFNKAAEIEENTKRLMNVYTTGVMYDTVHEKQELNDSCMNIADGQVIWYLARHLRPDLAIETGFGRGGSAAFILSALAPWSGRLISIDPAFRPWASETGITYLRELGLSSQHQIIEEPSEFALPSLIKNGTITSAPLSYVDGSHHFDGTLFDFMFIDKVTPVGGIIAIDDAHAPAVRTVVSFVANNLPYKFHYATSRLVLCQKIAETERSWDHFKPFHSSNLNDWNVHGEPPTPDQIPNATFS